MSTFQMFRIAPRAVALATAATVIAGVALAPSDVTAQSGREMTVTVHSIRAIDKLDVFSRADFFARVTVNGQTQNSPVVRQANQVNPEWKISARIPSGQQKVKLELFDKDLTKDEAIDINKVANKRDLDFTVTPNNRRCYVGGFSTSYRCGDRITRGGSERKAAEVTFSVDVK